MEVKKCGSKVFFCKNWQLFTEHYSICYGCYVDFKYEGNSKFNVVIYETNSFEICYPFIIGKTNGEPNTMRLTLLPKEQRMLPMEPNQKTLLFVPNPLTVDMR